MFETSVITNYFFLETWLIRNYVLDVFQSVKNTLNAIFILVDMTGDETVSQPSVNRCGSGLLRM